MRSFLKRSFAWQIVGIVFVFSIVAHAQNSADGIIFDAENATIKGYDKNNQIIELKNKVQIIYQGQYISCDDASIDTRHTVLSCKGHVRMVSSEAKLQADEIDLNYKNSTGEIKNGFVQVGQVLFEGEKIEKLSSTEYKATQGHYTACTNCPPFWSFSGSKLDAEIGGYAYISNATVYFGKVPALWFPYLVVPIKSKRQTGLLFPNFNYSGSDGFTMEESLFWAMSDNTDSTWSTEYYTHRGTKGLLNYRYVLSEQSKGEFDYAFLKDHYFSHTDTAVQPFNSNNALIDRWFLHYKHQYDLPYGFVQRININEVSDTLYPRDFPQELPSVWGDSALENRASLTKNTESAHWSLDTSYYRGMLYNNPLSANSLAVHRFPAINYSLMPSHIFDTNFLFSLDAHYTNFVRDNASFDSFDAGGNPIPNTGQYNPATDHIRTGQRLSVEPSVSYPIKFGEAINLVPSVAYNETHYQFPLGSETSTFRRYARTTVDLNTHFSGIYADPNNTMVSSFKHVIQPEISYTAIPWYEQPVHPFFGSNTFLPHYLNDQPISDNDNLQFDYYDRLYDKNLVTYSLTNKLWRKKWVNGTPQYQQIVSDKVWQSYDLYEARRQTNNARYPFSEISNLLKINIDNVETDFLLKYYGYQNTTTSASRIKVFNDKKDFIQFTYSKDFLLTNGLTSGTQSIDVNSKTEVLEGDIGFNIKLFQFIAGTSYDFINRNFQSYNYMIKFRPPGNCWALIFSQERDVNSEVKFNFNMSFLFDGKTETGLKGQQEQLPNNS